jgi:hypothetical protein
MENQNDQFEFEEVIDDDGNDVTDWKTLALEAQGKAKRYYSKYQKYKGEAKKAKPEDHKPEEKKTGLDYGQKAFLIANGIKGADEMELVNSYLASGKELEDIVDNKHFLADLEDLRNDKAVKAATPSSNKRTGNNARDEVEYWLAKGELPPADQVELRRKVVNAKIKAQSDGNPFSKNPVIK